MLSDTKTVSKKDFKNPINAITDEPAFNLIMAYIDYARTSSSVDIIIGSKGEKSKGYLIDPTVIVVSDPHFITMEENILSLLIPVYVNEEDKYAETLISGSDFYIRI